MVGEGLSDKKIEDLKVVFRARLNKFQNNHLPQQPVIVPTFGTKVTEYLCSGGFFFLQTNFDFLTSHF